MKKTRLMECPGAYLDDQTGKVRKQGFLKGLSGKLALLTVSTGICLLLLEFIVRALFPFFSPRAQIPFHATEDNFFLGPISQQVRQATPKGDYNVRVSFNQYGFRDTKDLRDSSERDIFVVGDSFSMGWGVEENQRYSNLLENKLARRVFNISIPEDIRGYSKLVKYAEKCGGKVRNLIIGVCLENDLRDYSDGRTGAEIFQEEKNKVHERFVRFLRQAGLRTVDMKPEFEQGGQPLSNYFSTDPHWNPSGHAAAARALLAAFQTR